MIRPQPEVSFGYEKSCSAGADMIVSGFWVKLASRMKRRKTVSVTPAMGASTVAGPMRNLPIWTHSGTRAPEGTVLTAAGFSQNLCIYLIYLIADFNIRG